MIQDTPPGQQSLVGDRAIEALLPPMATPRTAHNSKAQDYDVGSSSSGDKEDGLHGAQSRRQTNSNKAPCSDDMTRESTHSQAGSEQSAPGTGATWMGEDDVIGHETHELFSDYNPNSEGDNRSENDVDLFAQTFGNSPPPTSSAGSESDSSNSEDEGDTALKAPNNGNASAAPSPDRLDEYDFRASEHNRTCSPDSHGRLDTPTPPPPPTNRLPAPLGPPDPITSLSPNLKAQRVFHQRAVQFIPRLPLAKHRYWVGIAHISSSSSTPISTSTPPASQPSADGNIQSNTTYASAPSRKRHAQYPSPVSLGPSTFTSEKNFAWFKANRLTTVETLWQCYRSASATEDFVLLLGGREKVGLQEKLEELDYFGQKKVFFRAVEERRWRAWCAEGQARKRLRLTGGLVPSATERGEKRAVRAAGGSDGNGRVRLGKERVSEAGDKGDGDSEGQGDKEPEMVVID